MEEHIGKYHGQEALVRAVQREFDIGETSEAFDRLERWADENWEDYKTMDD